MKNAVRANVIYFHAKWVFKAAYPGYNPVVSMYILNTLLIMNLEECRKDK